MKKQIDSLQGARAVACFFVILHHCYITKIVTPFVSVFIILSGFLLSYNHFERPELSLSPVSCLRFSIKRVKKLYVLYILTLLPIMALDLYFMRPAPGSAEFATIIKELILSALLIQSWFPAHAYAFNGVAWYLSTSLFLYFCFPYIIRAIKRYKSQKTAFGVIILLYAAELLLGLAATPLSAHVSSVDAVKFESWFSYVFPPMRVFDFAIGCNLGYIFLQRGETERRGTAHVLDVACIVLFAVSAYIFLSGKTVLAAPTLRDTQLFLPFAAVFVYTFALGSGYLLRICTNKVTIFFGGLSGSIYLIHQDIIRFSYMLLDRVGLTLEQCKPILLVVCVALSVALALLYEKAQAAIRARREVKATV